MTHYHLVTKCTKYTNTLIEPMSTSVVHSSGLCRDGICMAETQVCINCNSYTCTGMSVCGLAKKGGFIHTASTMSSEHEITVPLIKGSDDTYLMEIFRAMNQKTVSANNCIMCRGEHMAPMFMTDRCCSIGVVRCTICTSGIYYGPINICSISNYGIIHTKPDSIPKRKYFPDDFKETPHGKIVDLTIYEGKIILRSSLFLTDMPDDDPEIICQMCRRRG